MSSELYDNTSTEEECSDAKKIANQVINKYAAKNTSNPNKRKSAPIVKDDDDYQKKRERNNVAVKKSREKAKNRIQETQSRVDQLSKENDDLQSKVTLLSKELHVLRALFTNGGFTLPVDLQYASNNGASEHSSNVSYSPHSRSPLDDSANMLSQSSPRHQYEEKPTYFSTEDTKVPTKIPPLRPRAYIPSTSPIHKFQPSKSYPTDSRYTIPSVTKQDYNKDTKMGATGPPLLIQHTSQSISNNLLPHKEDTRHPSVIRSTTDLGSSNSGSHKYFIMNENPNEKQMKLIGS